MKMGKVILVGAGPGDPELLTIKGQKAIQSAEVVVFDRLVSQAILNMIPADAERIDVGKEASHHKVPQEQINRILLEKALEGKVVVRLKGGDPFLFGRGGEELELLAENGVPFEEIPGITSAIAVPAYAGIPVTHRDFTSSLHIITGHQRAGKPLNIHFDALVKTGGTLVFLMGVSALSDICHGLMDAGMDPDMPSAIIEKGTTPAQRTITAPLSLLPQTAKEQLVKSPAIIIVGKVCAFADQFNWFEKLPLKGRQVIVTRPKERAGRLSDGLHALGAEVVELPCIETKPIIPCPEMEQAIAEISEYEWLVFTSPAGVTTLMVYLHRTGKDVRVLGQIKPAAIGTGTHRELQNHGLRADLIPEVYDGEHLGKALCEQNPSGKVLILRARMGTPALTQELDKNDIVYNDVRCYDTEYIHYDPEQVKELLTPGSVAAFTSASTVKGFVAAMGAETDYSGITAACIGVQTEAEAKKYGFDTITAKKATIEALIQTIVEGE